MKRFIVFFLFVAGILFSNTSQASHVIGGDIQYEYIGNNNYKILLTIYWEQSSFDPGATTTCNVKSASCNVNQTVQMTRQGNAYSASTVGAYDCISASNAGFSPMINDYQGIVSLPQQCNDYLISWTLCCRVGGITALQGSAGFSFYFEAELNNTLGPNNSPQFVSAPLSYICIGGFINYLQNATEVDGDSIQYELVPARDGANTPVTYAAGYSYTAPVTSSPANPFAINQKTGNITFTPTQAESSVIAVRVNEYRFDSTYLFWEKVGSSNREIQVVVAGNCLPAVNAGVQLDPNAPGISLDSLGRQTVDYNCLDSSITLKFTIPIECVSVSPDATDFRITNPIGQPIPIKALIPTCNNDGESSTLQVKLAKPLSYNGWYYLYSKIGNDGNTLLNKCGKDMAEFDTIILKVDNCINLEMELQNVSIIDDEHPKLTWEVDTATFPKFLFNLYRIYRSEDGGATYAQVGTTGDTNATSYIDASISPGQVDTRSYRYKVTMILNGQPADTTNSINSIWLTGDMSDINNIPVSWKKYDGWNNATYTVEWGVLNQSTGEYDFSVYGQPTNPTDTFMTITHTGLDEHQGDYAVRVHSKNSPNGDTAYSNVITKFVPEPPIPPVEETKVPNIITTNGDGRNDGFIVPGLDSYTTSRYVAIYTRWGQLVYENDSYSNSDPWLGTDKSGNKVADGVYMYVIRLYDEPNNDRQEYNGHVTVTSN